MNKVQYTYWQEKDGWFLGYLNEFPDHWTQGTSLEDLQENLRDLHGMFTKENIPGIKRVGELQLDEV
jgi:predicted RNase H-like HicB family nuclease